MSLETLNRIVGEAIVNASFCRALLSDPRAAVQDYELGADELAVLSSIRAGSVDNLAEQILAGLELEFSNGPLRTDPGVPPFAIGGPQKVAYGSAQAFKTLASASTTRLVMRLSAC